MYTNYAKMPLLCFDAKCLLLSVMLTENISECHCAATVFTT